MQQLFDLLLNKSIACFIVHFIRTGERLSVNVEDNILCSFGTTMYRVFRRVFIPVAFPMDYTCAGALRAPALQNHVANILVSRMRVISVTPLGDSQFISTASRSRQNSQHNTHSLESVMVLQRLKWVC